MTIINKVLTNQYIYISLKPNQTKSIPSSIDLKSNIPQMAIATSTSSDNRKYDGGETEIERDSGLKQR